MENEVHEHPFFNGQYHQAVWVYQWASGGTNSEPPPDCLQICAICGRIKEA